MITKKNYRPRILIVFLLFTFLFVIVGIRLYLLQINRKDFFQTLARQQYITEVTTHPPRAFIYDRNNVPLTLNREVSSAFILPHQLKEPDRTKSFLKQHFPSAIKRLHKESGKHFLWVERCLSDAQMQLIKQMPDIHIMVEQRRFYPYPHTAHLIGFTDIDNVGIAGMELQCNNQVGGTPTTCVIEKDARSGHFYFEQEVKEKGATGTPVTLTIDNALQYQVLDELKKHIAQQGGNGGAVLIINPDTGEILTMASLPEFDPNQKNITNLEQTKNVAVTECFELGSVIKIFAALAALDEGVVTLDEEIDCMGKGGYIDGFKVGNWKPMDVLPFMEVISKSSNIGTAKVVKRVGSRFYDHMRKLGFGNATKIQFPGERSGFVNPPHNWSRSSLIVMSFGYEIMATLLQLGKAFCVIANGGYDVQPTLLQNEPSAHSGKHLYKSETIEQVKQIMDAKGWVKDFYDIPGYRVMGKSGTARKVVDGKYSSKHHVYTYAGIIEKDDYRRVVITFVKDAKNPNVLAAQLLVPLFHKIATRMVVRDSLV